MRRRSMMSGDEQLDSAGRDGADGQLRNFRRAELADHPHVEGHVQSLGNLEGDGNSAARQGENEEIGLIGEGEKLLVRVGGRHRIGW